MASLRARGLFVLWWALLAAGVAAITLAAGELPVDYRTYAEAAARAEATGSPYAPAEAAQGVWRRMHESALAVFRPESSPEEAGSVVSGPYLYPPTLALRLPGGAWAAAAFLALTAGAAAATALGWLRAAGARSGWWLALAALAPAAPASLAGGNAELLAVGLTLGACGLAWSGRGLWAGPPAALALLLKPHFALVFAAFALLAPGPVRRAAGLAALAGGALMALEAASWPEAARADFLAYLAEPMARQYWALPEAERWPMSLWNRAPAQLFATLGPAPGAAVWAALGLWAGLAAASLAALRGRAVGFAPLFAVAWTLFLIARPVSWTLPWLELIVLAAAWPALGRGGRIALAALAAALVAGRWAAFVAFAGGSWPGLLSLQTPAAPWETALLLPGAWALSLWAARRRAA